MRSPRRARSRYAGRFCLRSVTFTSVIARCLCTDICTETTYVPQAVGSTTRCFADALFVTRDRPPTLSVARNLAIAVPSGRLHAHGQCLETAAGECDRASGAELPTRPAKPLLSGSPALFCAADFLFRAYGLTKRRDKLRKAELRRPNRARNSSRDVGDYGVEQRRAHCGHANASPLVEFQKTVFDQASNPLRVNQAAANLLKRPRVDAFA
jgi:hypothetical protein